MQTAISATNAAFSFKRQVALPKLQELEQLTAQVESAHVNNTGEIDLHIHQLLVSFPPVQIGSISVLPIVTSLSSIVGRPVQLAFELDRSCRNLDQLLERMNLVIAEIRAIEDRQTRIFAILGLSQGDSNPVTDERLRNIIDGIKLVVDDVIFFSRQIAFDISDHQIAWRKRNRVGKRKRLKLLLSPESESLLPNNEVHLNWLKIPVTPLE